MRYYTRNNQGLLTLHTASYHDPDLMDWARNDLRADQPVERTKLRGWPDRAVIECNRHTVLIPSRAARKLGVIK